eukprot:2111125-Rhodomonas_salina.2
MSGTDLADKVLSDLVEGALKMATAGSSLRYLPTRVLCTVRCWYRHTRVHYAVSGTETAYAAIRRHTYTLYDVRYLHTACWYQPTHLPVSCYALPTWRPVLTLRMVLPGRQSAFVVHAR